MCEGAQSHLLRWSGRDPDAHSIQSRSGLAGMSAGRRTDGRQCATYAMCMRKKKDALAAVCLEGIFNTFVETPQISARDYCAPVSSPSARRTTAVGLLSGLRPLSVLSSCTCGQTRSAQLCHRSIRAQRGPQTRPQHAQGMGVASRRQGRKDDPATHQGNARVKTAAYLTSHAL